MELSFFEKIMAELFIVVYLFSIGLISNQGIILGTLKDKGFVLKALLLNVLIIPMIALSLTWIFTFPSDIKTGIILLGICPGGLFTLNFVRVSHGNINLAIALTGLFSLIAILIMPVCIFFLAGSSLNFPFYLWIICRLFMLILIPLYLGRFLANYIPKSRSWAVSLGILSIIIFIVFNLLTTAHKSEALALLGWNAIVAMILLVFSGWILGFLMGGTDPANKKTLSISTSMRNVAFCYPFALYQFADTNVIAPVVAFSGISIVMNMLFVLMINYLTKKRAFHGRNQ